MKHLPVVTRVYLLLIVAHSLVVCEIPSDWKRRIAHGDLLVSESRDVPTALMPDIGNGYLATRLTSNETFVAGIFNGLSVETPSHRARIPSTVRINLSGENLVYVAGGLDLQNATYYERYVRDTVNVEVRWYCHRRHRSIMVVEIELWSDVPVQNDFLLKLERDFTLRSEDMNLKEGAMHGLYIFTGQTLQPEVPGYSTTETVAVVTTVLPPNITVAASTTPFRSVHYFITAIRTSIDSKAPLDTAFMLYSSMYSQRNSLHQQHIDEWSTFLQSKVEVVGDLDLVQKVNASFYYILTSIRQDYPWGIPTCGLATNGYNGHVFSDSETWLTPALIPFYPSLAASVLDYRYNHMEGARKKAASYNKNYQGTMYCWECAYTGVETCPLFAATGELEQHVSGDIGIAVKRHWDYTGDLQWLTQKGYPLIKGIAEFWASRVTKNADGKFVINGVVDMDERTLKLGSVNNSLYTNVCAKISIEFAIQASKILNQTTPTIWHQIVENMYYPFDNSLQINLAWDGSEKYQWGGLPVLMLGYPVSGFEIDPNVRRNDVLFYTNNRTYYPQAPKGMTHSMMAIGWLDIGREKEGFNYFVESQEDLNWPFLLPSELQDGGCSGFITGCGGFLQTILSGYGGIRIKTDRLVLNPKLPPNASQFTFRQFKYWGNVFDIRYTRDRLTLTMIQRTGAKLLVTDSAGKTQAFTSGELQLETGLTVITRSD